MQLQLSEEFLDLVKVSSNLAIWIRMTNITEPTTESTPTNYAEETGTTPQSPYLVKLLLEESANTVKGSQSDISNSNKRALKSNGGKYLYYICNDTTNCNEKRIKKRGGAMKKISNGENIKLLPKRKK